MNIFDSLQNTMFDVVTGTMGYDAQWLPNGAGDFDAADFNPNDFLTYQGALIPGRILYNGPTEKEKLLDANFDPDKLTMEYKLGVFDGLFESVEDGVFEPVKIIDIGVFRVKSISKKFDGKTFIAVLARV